MKTFEKESNGHTLKIVVDGISLLSEIDDKIKEFEDIKKEFGGDNVPDDEDAKWEMQSVYGDLDEYCTPNQILDDLNDFKNLINSLIESDGSELWKNVSLKKNGTFKKNCKPILKEAIFGSYWEDSYGWNTLVLRLEPRDDTTVNMLLDTIVLHY